MAVSGVPAPVTKVELAEAALANPNSAISASLFDTKRIKTPKKRPSPANLPPALLHYWLWHNA